MQYMAAVFAFVAVVVGITRNTWNQELQQPTQLGWVTIAIAAASLLVSVVLVYRDHKKLDWRAKVKKVAEREMREALDHVLHPFGTLWMNMVYAPSSSKVGEMAKSLKFDERRFYRDAEYLAGKLKEAAFLEAWEHFDLRRDPAHPPIYPSFTWAQFFTTASDRGNEKFESTVAKYSTYLEPEVLLQVHALQACEFFKMRLRELPVLLEANQHMPEYVVSMAFTGPEEHKPYLRFVDRVVSLAMKLPARECE
jgi:hypothetical protein